MKICSSTTLYIQKIHKENNESSPRNCIVLIFLKTVEAMVESEKLLILAAVCFVFFSKLKPYKKILYPVSQKQRAISKISMYEYSPTCATQYPEFHCLDV